ncbi:MAG TPA: hypothetical protein VE244_16375 [Nitrososphaeraceae archaeon]|nr:hypothetical protein [Nitrososphaeraceae archaeon]
MEWISKGWSVSKMTGDVHDPQSEIYDDQIDDYGDKFSSEKRFMK